MTGAEVDALRLPLKEKLSSVSDLPAHIVAFRGVLAQLTIAGHAPITLDVQLSPPFPCSTSTLCCLLWHTGRLRNIRSRLTPLTSFRNTTTFWPTLTPDLSRGLRKERVRMKWWTETLFTLPTPHHTPNTQSPMQCNNITRNHHNTPNTFYHLPWPWLPTLLRPLTCPHMRRSLLMPLQTRKVLDSKQGKKQGKKGQNQPKEWENGHSLALLSRARPSSTSIVTSMVGWPPTGGHLVMEVTMETLVSSWSLAPPSSPLPC